MNHLPLVTVIIPSYNYGIFIDQAIRSVLRQDIVHLTEIIIVDDGSTDDTERIVKKYASHRIKYIYQNNRGLSSARNTGIKNSCGKFLQFLDADDLLGKNAISGRLEMMSQNPDVQIAICKVKMFNNFILGTPNTYTLNGWPTYKKNLEIHLCNFNIAPPNAFLVRKEVIEKVGMFDTNLKACEDYDFWLRALFTGYRIRYCPNGVVYYRFHKNSMSKNEKRQRIYDTVLHNKLKGLLENSLIGGRSDALFAFISGVLCTYYRFSTLKIKPPHELISLFNWAIKKINCLDDITTFLCYFYFCESMLTLKYLKKEEHNINNFENQLLSIARNNFGFNFKNKIFLKEIKNILSHQKYDLLEYYRLLKYITHRFI